MDAVVKHIRLVTSAFNKAKESKDEKQTLCLFFTVKVVATMINNALPDKKLKINEDSFNSAAAPSELDCPNVDKPFCEMDAKVKKAIDGVLAVVPLADIKKKGELYVTIIEKIMYPASSTINKAYADGDHVLVSYTKAADEVIATARAGKFKVMEKTFIDAAAAGN